MRARPVVLAALLIAAPLLLPAQTVTGALDGRAVATTGEPLEDAVATVSGPFLQGTRRVTADARGRFLFLALPAGTYTVELRRPGFAPARLTGIAVRLGSTTALGDVALAPQVVQLEPVEVSAARPLLDAMSSAASVTMDSSFFLALATSRDFVHLTTLLPQVAPSPFDSATGDYLGPNAGGATEVENAYYVDGVDISGIGEFAIAEKTLPFNFVREIQVLTGGYEAEYGRALGSVTSVVTNAGGNDFHGQMLGFYSSDALRASPQWGYNETQVSSYTTWDLGLSLSGPLRRDRLWYFVAYNPWFSDHAIAFDGITPQRDRAVRHLFAGKLTWRAAEATDLAFTIIGDPLVQRRVNPLGASMPSTVTDADAVLSDDTRGGYTLSAQARHQRRRSLLTLTAAYTDNRLSHYPVAPAPDFTSLATVYDYTTNTVSGNSGIDSHARNRRTSVQASVTIAAGDHTLKAGAGYEASWAGIWPRWSQIKVTPDSVHPYNWTTLDQVIEGYNHIPSAYLQDSWAVTPRIRVNAGVRWDRQMLGGVSGMRTRLDDAVSPRMGVVLQPGAIGRSKITLSAGRFYQMTPAYSAAIWGGRGSYLSLDYATDPRTTAATPDTAAYFELGAIPDQRIRGQYHDEITAGYERLLGPGLKVSVRGIARSLRWAVDDAPVGPGGVYVFGNVGSGSLASRPRATREYRALELVLERSGSGRLAYLVSYVLSRNRGNYAGLYEQDMPTSGGGGNAGWGYDVPDTDAVSTGLLPNDRTHLFKLAGAYRFGTAVSVGATGFVSSGTPRSEYGASSWKLPWVVFVQPRGSAGRTSWTWDLNLRGAWSLPSRGRVRPQLVLDVFHVASPKRAVWYDDLHYTKYHDAAGAWSNPNPNYGRVQAYQEPMSARLGMAIDF